MNSFEKLRKGIGLFLTITFFLIVQNNYAQEEEFPYAEIDWSSYMTGYFDLDGNILTTGKTVESDDWQPRPYQFLEPFVSNPDADAYHYMAKISGNQDIEFVNLFGPPIPENPTSFYASFRGRILTDDLGNIYYTGNTATEEGIGTENGYHPNFHHNWSDPYEMYVPELDMWVTIPPFHLRDAFIMKFNPQGEKLWGSYYNGNQEVENQQPFVQGDYIYL